MCVFDMRKWNRLILFDDIFDQRFFHSKARHPMCMCVVIIFIYMNILYRVFFSLENKKQFFILEFVCLFVYIIFSFFCLENEDNIMQSLKHVRVCIPIVLISLIWMHTKSCADILLYCFFCC